jgi:protein SCO1/2
VRTVTAGLALALTGAAVLLWLRPAEPPRIVHQGEAAIAARYLLTDHTGRSTGPEAWAGRRVVYLFGWTKDPDLTPAALQVLAAALDRPPTTDIVPVFISLDPARDDAVTLKRYLAMISPRLTGLTGSAADIAALARAMRLHVRRLDDPSLPGGYGLEHTLVYYVFGRDGRFAGLVPYETDPAVVRAGLDAIDR